MGAICRAVLGTYSVHTRIWQQENIGSLGVKEKKTIQYSVLQGKYTIRSSDEFYLFISPGNYNREKMNSSKCQVLLSN